MAVHTIQDDAPRLLVPWRECGRGHEARIFEKTDAQGKKSLTAETRPTVDTYQPVPPQAQPARVTVTIPYLTHAALGRNAGNARMRLTTSPSLNELTVGLRAMDDIGRGLHHSGEWLKSAAEGPGWMVDGPKQRQYIGQFAKGKFTDPNGRIEYADGAWYEGNVECGTPEGFGTMHKPGAGGRDFIFRGHWVDGTKIEGLQEYTPESFYMGQMEHGERHGEGFHQMNKTCWYLGGWSKGYRHGHGVNKVGPTLSYGPWRNDTLCDKNVCVTASGEATRLEPGGEWENLLLGRT